MGMRKRKWRSPWVIYWNMLRTSVSYDKARLAGHGSSLEERKCRLPAASAWTGVENQI